MTVKKKIFPVLILFMATGISYLAYYSFLEFELSRKISNIRKGGYPATAEELEKWYPTPPSGQNAADFYMKAADNYNRNPDNVDDRFLIIKDGCVDIPSSDVSLPEEIIKNSECYLQANRKSLEFLHEAAKFKSCRYPVEIKNPDRRLAYLSNLRQGLRLLSMEAVLAAEKGDSSKTLKALLAAAALSSSLENEPTIDSLAAMMAVEHITLGNIERIVNRCDFNADQLKQISEKFAVFDEMKSIERAFAGERTYILSGHYLDEYMEYVDYNFPLVRKNAILKKSMEFLSDILLLWKMNDLTSVKFVSELVDICKTSPESALLKTGDIQSRIQNLPAHLFAAKLYLPLLFPVLNKKAMTISETRVAIAGIAVLSYRLKNGRMPENTAVLVPEYIDSFPVDPMNGKPLHYRKTDNGALVYSVGTDGIDNGGYSGINNGNSKGEDFVFRISASSK